MTSSNKKVLIIGATSGIGRALADLYCDAGCDVAITGRRKELLDEFNFERETKHRISKNGSKVLTACFDVRGDENISNLEQVILQLGGLDLLIYNSGYGEVSEKLDWEIEKRTYETNVKGFIEIIHFAYTFFVKQGHGQIAATSSIASIRGNGFTPAYSASKAFMSVYMEGLHIKSQKTKSGVIITDIQPGFVDTHMAKGNKQFWVTPVQKAAKQIFDGIEKERSRIYVTKRWWLIAQIMKWAPGWIYYKVG
jgi:short-subunit dehydrogenase